MGENKQTIRSETKKKKTKKTGEMRSPASLDHLTSIASLEERRTVESTDFKTKISTVSLESNSKGVDSNKQTKEENKPKKKKNTMKPWGKKKGGGGGSKTTRSLRG